MFSWITISIKDFRYSILYKVYKKNNKIRHAKVFGLQIQLDYKNCVLSAKEIANLSIRLYTIKYMRHFLPALAPNSGPFCWYWVTSVPTMVSMAKAPFDRHLLSSQLHFHKLLNASQWYLLQLASWALLYVEVLTKRKTDKIRDYTLLMYETNPMNTHTNQHPQQSSGWSF